MQAHHLLRRLKYFAIELTEEALSKTSAYIPRIGDEFLLLHVIQPACLRESSGISMPET
ncbi:MAG: hypothetical protein ACI89S_000883, partial [Gammaproteobacteria bacterium]